VELAGIEPASSDADSGLLRVQSAGRFLSPGVRADDVTDRLSRCKSPSQIPRPDLTSKPPQ